MQITLYKLVFRDWVRLRSTFSNKHKAGKFSSNQYYSPRKRISFYLKYSIVYICTPVWHTVNDTVQISKVAKQCKLNKWHVQTRKFSSHLLYTDYKKVQIEKETPVQTRKFSSHFVFFPSKYQ